MRSKGDTIQFRVTVDENVTNWKIRAEVFDKSGNSCKLATENSGGSDDQIEKVITDPRYSIFVIYVPSGVTTQYDEDAEIEIEVDTGIVIGGEPEIITIYKGKLKLLKEQITWSTPS